GPGSPAECGLLLEEVHLVPLRGQERGGGEPGDAAADDRGAAGHRAVTTLRATMPALTRSGTRTRVRAMSQAGVSRSRTVRAPKRACAACTARRQVGGSSRIASAATA